MTDEDMLEACSRVESYFMSLKPKAGAGIPRGWFDDMELMVEIVRQVVEKEITFPSPPDKRMEHMTEPELSEHLTRQLRFIKGCQSEDTIGSMLIVFQEDGITQYGSTVHPENVPAALRELADRLEKRETVERN